MSRTDVPDDGYRRLGLLANPFAVLDDGSADSDGIKLASQAAAYRLLTALGRAADDADHRPVFVRKADIPASYHVKALARTLAELASDAYDQNLFSVYVPLDMLKMGRVRAVLSATAERAAGVSPELTIGKWAQKALAEPDKQLVEWGFLEELGDIPALTAEFEADPAAAASRIFGEPVQSREGAEDLEMVMRVSHSRQDRLETDPAEGEEGLSEQENPADDPLLEVFATPLVEGEEVPEPEEPAADPAALLADYVVAYTKANLSPVVARGLRAYMAQGTASMAQELKITKAPTKTLVALLGMLSERYRGAVVVYDRLEMWEAMPQDLRLKVVNTFASLRWAIKEYGTLCITAIEGAAPEVEETFAAATPVEWDFSELGVIAAVDAPFDAEVALRWAASASIDGEAPSWCEEVVAAVPDGVQLAVATAALANVIDEAVSRGGTPDPSAVPAALEKAQEAPAT